MSSVHMLQYSHRHGVDVCLYDTRLHALQQAAFIMLDWFDEFRETSSTTECAALLKHIRSSDYEAALVMWNNTMPDEHMTIEEQVVDVTADDSATMQKLDALLNRVEQDEASREQDEAAV